MQPVRAQGWEDKKAKKMEELVQKNKQFFLLHTKWEIWSFKIE